jgi:hypothetical protein
MKAGTGRGVYVGSRQRKKAGNGWTDGGRKGILGVKGRKIQGNGREGGEEKVYKEGRHEQKEEKKE